MKAGPSLGGPALFFNRRFNMGVWRDTMYAWYASKYPESQPFLSTPEGIVVSILLTIIITLIICNMFKKK
jgi:hypothetical protein